jgi:hypothetical protein
MPRARRVTGRVEGKDIVLDDAANATSEPTLAERCREVALQDPVLVWAGKVRASWQKAVASIVETGRLLNEAKTALPHGGFEIMVRDLPFGMRAAQRLMTIAAHPVLSNAAHGSHLPASWRTLSELTVLDKDELEIALGNHWIKPDMERKDVPGLVARVKKALGKRVRRTTIEDPEEAPSILEPEHEGAQTEPTETCTTSAVSRPQRTKPRSRPQRWAAGLRRGRHRLTSPARAHVTWEFCSTLWRPQVGDVIEGTVVSEFGRWPGLVEPLRTLVVELPDGARVHVARASWLSLHEELKRERPLRGDRVRLERRPDDGAGRRQFHVERLDDADDYFVTVTPE